MTTVDAPQGVASMHPLALPAVPASAAVRVHHTQWASSSFSYLRQTPMSLQNATARDASRVRAAVAEQLHFSDVAGMRVLALTSSRHDDTDITPVTAYWCMDEIDRLIAVAVELHIDGEAAQLCSINPEQFVRDTLTGTVSVRANGQTVTGRVHLTLSAERVAIGVQIPVEGNPVLTASLSGTFE